MTTAIVSNNNTSTSCAATTPPPPHSRNAASHNAALPLIDSTVCSGVEEEKQEVLNVKYPINGVPVGPVTSPNVSSCRRRLMFAKGVFQGESFYVDQKSLSAQDVTTLEKGIKEFGGVIEKFLCKDVSYLVTSADTRRGAGSSHHGDTSPATPPAPPAKAIMSRGKALLLKAQTHSPQTADILDTAKQLGIKVVAATQVFRRIEKERSKCGTRGIGLSPDTSVTRVKSLKGNYIKFEDIGAEFRPVHHTFSGTSFPRVNTAVEHSGCPFDVVNPSTKRIKKTRPVSPKSSPKSSPKTKKRQAVTNSYCELCNALFTDLKEHVKSSTHVKFMEDKENFKELDGTIAKLPTLTHFVCNDVNKGVASVPMRYDDSPVLNVLSIPDNKNDDTDSSAESSSGSESASSSGSDSEEDDTPAMRQQQHQAPAPQTVVPPPQAIHVDSIYDSMLLPAGHLTPNTPLSAMTPSTPLTANGHPSGGAGGRLSSLAPAADRDDFSDISDDDHVTAGMEYSGPKLPGEENMDHISNVLAEFSPPMFLDTDLDCAKEAAAPSRLDTPPDTPVVQETAPPMDLTAAIDDLEFDIPDLDTFQGADGNDVDWCLEDALGEDQAAVSESSFLPSPAPMSVSSVGSSAIHSPAVAQSPAVVPSPAFAQSPAVAHSPAFAQSPAFAHSPAVQSPAVAQSPAAAVAHSPSFSAQSPNIPNSQTHSQPKHNIPMLHSPAAVTTNTAVSSPHTAASPIVIEPAPSPVKVPLSHSEERNKPAKPQPRSSSLSSAAAITSASTSYSVAASAAATSAFMSSTSAHPTMSRPGVPLIPPHVNLELHLPRPMMMHPPAPAQYLNPFAPELMGVSGMMPPHAPPQSWFSVPGWNHMMMPPPATLPWDPKLNLSAKNNAVLPPPPPYQRTMDIKVPKESQSSANPDLPAHFAQFQDELADELYKSQEKKPLPDMQIEDISSAEESEGEAELPFQDPVSKQTPPPPPPPPQAGSDQTANAFLKLDVLTSQMNSAIEKQKKETAETEVISSRAKSESLYPVPTSVNAETASIAESLYIKAASVNAETVSKAESLYVKAASVNAGTASKAESLYVTASSVNAEIASRSESLYVTASSVHAETASKSESPYVMAASVDAETASKAESLYVTASSVNAETSSKAFDKVDPEINVTDNLEMEEKMEASETCDASGVVYRHKKWGNVKLPSPHHLQSTKEKKVEESKEQKVEESNEQKVKESKDHMERKHKTPSVSLSSSAHANGQMTSISEHVNHVDISEQPMQQQSAQQTSINSAIINSYPVNSVDSANISVKCVQSPTHQTSSIHSKEKSRHKHKKRSRSRSRDRHKSSKSHHSSSSHKSSSSHHRRKSSTERSGSHSKSSSHKSSSRHHSSTSTSSSSHLHKSADPSVQVTAEKKTSSSSSSSSSKDKKEKRKSSHHHKKHRSSSSITPTTVAPTSAITANIPVTPSAATAHELSLAYQPESLSATRSDEKTASPAVVHTADIAQVAPVVLPVKPAVVRSPVVHRFKKPPPFNNQSVPRVPEVVNSMRYPPVAIPQYDDEQSVVGNVDRIEFSSEPDLCVNITTTCQNIVSNLAASRPAAPSPPLLQTEPAAAAAPPPPKPQPVPARSSNRKAKSRACQEIAKQCSELEACDTLDAKVVPLFRYKDVRPRRVFPTPDQIATLYKPDPSRQCSAAPAVTPAVAAAALVTDHIAVNTVDTDKVRKKHKKRKKKKHKSKDKEGSGGADVFDFDTSEYDHTNVNVKDDKSNWSLQATAGLKLRIVRSNSGDNSPRVKRSPDRCDMNGEPELKRRKVNEECAEINL